MKVIQMAIQYVLGALGVIYGGTRGAQQKPLVPEPITNVVSKPVVKEKVVIATSNGSALPDGRLHASKVVLAAQDYILKYPKLEQVDPVVTAAMAMTESGGNTVNLNPFATRYEAGFHEAYVPQKSKDYATSYGILQVMLQTADELWLKGYNAFPRPTAATLTRNADNLYFAMALQADYKNRNSKARNSEQWLVRAYNGGLGWENTRTGPEQTLKHYNKYAANRATLISAIA